MLTFQTLCQQQAQQEAQYKAELAERGLQRAESLEKEILRLNRHVASVEQVAKSLFLPLSLSPSLYTHTHTHSLSLSVCKLKASPW